MQLRRLGMMTLAVTCGVYLGACRNPSADTGEVVRTSSGSVSGVLEPGDSIRVFRGIPFAAPPVGEQRWRPPGPVVPWEGVRRADQFSKGCMQPSRSPNRLMRPDDGPVSEDCLYLNVWTPAQLDDHGLPVLVWIHGGGNRHGTASMVHYNGTELAGRGLVVVSLNYRLGPFGFLAHPELTEESEHDSSGNYALLDQLAALRWVKTNIAAFGGDPDRVTICGQSAGSSNARNLMVSPLARGLVHGVIGQSGGFGSRIARRLDAAEKSGIEFLESVGAASIADLRRMPPDGVFKGQGGRMGPIVDGWVVPDDPYRMVSESRHNNVPVLVGSNADEGATRGVSNRTEFLEQIQEGFGDRAGEFLALYPADTEEAALASQYASASDRTFSSMRTWARLVHRNNSKSYLYLFSRVPPLPEGALPPRDPGSSERQGLGAYHGAELVYMFGTLKTRDWPWIQTDHALSDAMVSYWANFVKHGDPNGESLPAWPPFTDAMDDMAMDLGDSIGMQKVARSAGLDFHERKH